MLGIVDRYLFWQVAKVFAAILAVLVSIVVSLMLLRTLEEVSVGGLSVDLILRFVRLQLLRDSASLLPPAFFLALLLALSRLARDSELVALNACGIGVPRLYRSLLLLAVPVAMLTAYVSLAVKHRAAAEIQQIRWQQSEQAAQIGGLQAGRFYVENDGQVVVYVGAIDHRRNQLGDVFIVDRRDQPARLVASDGGAHRIDAQTGDHLVTLTQGYRFDGDPGSARFLVGQFAEYRIRIANRGPVERQSLKRATRPTDELWRSTDLADRVELEHRAAAPLAVLLVEVSPRRRASGRVALAVLAYFSFFNLQRVAETWLASGVTPLWLSSLWYQPLILGLVYLAVAPDSFWLRRLRHRLGGARRRGAHESVSA